MKRKKTLLISLAILLLGGGVALMAFLTEPTAQRAGATRKTAMLVEVVQARRDTFRPAIMAMGTVEPAQDIVLSPRVSGQIIRRSKAFTPGGYVMEGETLLKIDPADYRNDLQQSRSDLRQAEADLNIEMGRQNVAREDYRLLDETLSQEQEKLILRRPQLNSARSRVEAARAAVEQARLNLERTSIRAPFHAQVLTRNVNTGSQVSPGDNLARLVGLDTYWIETSVPVSKLRWLSFPDRDQQKGSPVRIRNRTAWEKGGYRTGHLYKMVGALEDQTRMARVLVEVPDPLLLNQKNGQDPRLIIGSFVETHIQGKKIPGVIRLNRDYIRKNETVWVMKDQKLDIRPVDIVFRDNTYAYITGGLSENDSVVTTNIATVVEGASLRLASDSTN